MFKLRRKKNIERNNVDLYSLSALIIYHLIDEDRTAEMFSNTDFVDALEIGKEGYLKPLVELMFKHTSLARPSEIKYTKGHVEFIEYK